MQCQLWSILDEWFSWKLQTFLFYMLLEVNKKAEHLDGLQLAHARALRTVLNGVTQTLSEQILNRHCSSLIKIIILFFSNNYYVLTQPSQWALAAFWLSLQSTLCFFFFLLFSLSPLSFSTWTCCCPRYVALWRSTLRSLCWRPAPTWSALFVPTLTPSPPAQTWHSASCWTAWQSPSTRI